MFQNIGLLLVVVTSHLLQTCVCDTPSSQGSKTLFGNKNQTITISLYDDTSTAEIKFSGPDGVWYGVGFNNTMMNGTYAIIVDGYGNVTERMLGYHQSGLLLTPTVTVTSDTTDDSGRTVVLTRSMTGKGAYYYTFDSSISSINLIYAFGNTPTLAQHQNENIGAIQMTQSLSDDDDINTNNQVQRNERRHL